MIVLNFVFHLSIDFGTWIIISIWRRSLKTKYVFQEGHCYHNTVSTPDQHTGLPVSHSNIYIDFHEKKLLNQLERLLIFCDAYCDSGTSFVKMLMYKDSHINPGILEKCCFVYFSWIRKPRCKLKKQDATASDLKKEIWT